MVSPTESKGIVKALADARKNVIASIQHHLGIKSDGRWYLQRHIEYESSYGVQDVYGVYNNGILLMPEHNRSSEETNSIASFDNLDTPTLVQILSQLEEVPMPEMRSWNVIIELREIAISEVTIPIGARTKEEAERLAGIKFRDMGTAEVKEKYQTGGTFFRTDTIDVVEATEGV